MDRRDDMRAGDADREAVAERLRAALDEGRLDLHEYDERLQRAYGAKTFGDLHGLLDDLPGTVPPGRARLAPVTGATPATNPLPEVGPALTIRWLADVWDRYFGVVAIVVAIWAVISLMSGDLIYFWPGWVAGPWGAVLLVQTISGLATGEPRKWAQRKERDRERKHLKRERKALESGEDGD
ncbi:MAG TPA: DUF1707 domain-containing protein [Asanoa sp.]